MLILTGSVVNSKQEALCSVCYKVVGLFEPRELWLMARDMDAIYCFDCDQVAADSVPDVLYDISGRYFFTIDGQLFSINIWEEVKAKTKLISQKNTRIGALYEHLLEVLGGG
jgi:hypothetical protein